MFQPYPLLAQLSLHLGKIIRLFLSPSVSHHLPISRMPISFSRVCFQSICGEESPIFVFIYLNILTFFVHFHKFSIETSPQKTIAAPAAVTHQVQSGAVNGMASPLKVGASNGVAAPTEDRYSALKDLDALFTTQTTPISEPSVSAAANWNPSWNTGTAQAATAAPPTHLHHHSESVFSSHNNAAAAAVAVETPVAWSSFTPSNSSNPSNPFLGK